LINRVDKIIDETEDVVISSGGGAHTGGSEDINTIIDNLYSPNLPFMERIKTSKNTITFTSSPQDFDSDRNGYSMRAVNLAQEQINVVPFLHPIKRVLETAFESDKLINGSGKVYPIFIGGDDDEPVTNPVTGDEIVDDEGNKATIG
jgi:hypothetical protein